MKPLSKDSVSGGLFILAGLAFLWIGLGYSFGTMRQMGAGFFPVVLSVLLILLGAVVLVRALVQGGVALESVNLKGVVLVLGATLLFGLIVRSAGLVPSVILLVLISAAASIYFKFTHAALLALGLAAFCFLVFIEGLGMPVQALGYWFGY